MAQTYSTLHGLPVEMESVSNVTATNSVDLGTVRYFNGEEYIYVYNAGTGQINPGMYATLSANSGYSVSPTGITMYDLPIGFAKHTTLTAGTYGWLLTRGFCNVMTKSNVSVAVSDIGFPGAGGQVGILSQQTSLQCGVVFLPVAYFVSAAATVGASTGAVANAYVRCFGT